MSRQTVRGGGSDTSLILVEDVPSRNRKTVHRLKNRTVIIGRSSDCDILVNHIGCSRRHAEVEKSNSGKCYLRDLGSTYGTFIQKEAGLERIEANRWVQLPLNRKFVLGESDRVFQVCHGDNGDHSSGSEIQDGVKTNSSKTTSSSFKNRAKIDSGFASDTRSGSAHETGNHAQTIPTSKYTSGAPAEKQRGLRNNGSLSKERLAGASKYDKSAADRFTAKPSDGRKDNSAPDCVARSSKQAYRTDLEQSNCREVHRSREPRQDRDQELSPARRKIQLARQDFMPRSSENDRSGSRTEKRTLQSQSSDGPFDARASNFECENFASPKHPSATGEQGIRWRRDDDKSALTVSSGDQRFESEKNTKTKIKPAEKERNETELSSKSHQTAAMSSKSHQTAAMSSKSHQTAAMSSKSDQTAAKVKKSKLLWNKAETALDCNNYASSSFDSAKKKQKFLKLLGMKDHQVENALMIDDAGQDTRKKNEIDQDLEKQYALSIGRSRTRLGLG